MDKMKDSLGILARKLTPVLAFAILVVILMAWLGKDIPPVFQALIYIVVIGGLIVYTVEAVLPALKQRQAEKPAATPPAQPEPAEKTPPAPQPEKGTPPSASPQDPQPDPPPAPAGDPLRAYLEAVVGDCSPLRLVGLDPQASDASRGRPTLEAIYVSLDTLTQEPAEEPEKGKSAGPGDREKQRPLSALKALATGPERRMVLLGLPGTGKSTFVRYLALRLARALLDRSLSLAELLPGWQGGAVVPLIVSLGRFAETLPANCKAGSADLLERFICTSLQADERTAAFASLALAELERSGGLLLFDGLDEVAAIHLRPVVVQSVERFCARYSRNPACRFLITCRTYSYHHDARWQLTGWPVHELALLDPQKIDRFIAAWHAEHARLDPARQADYARKQSKLAAALQPGQRRRLDEIAAFPLILTVMAVVHTHYGELPDTRAEVYEKCIDLLLIRWAMEREVSGQANQQRSLLDALAVQRPTLELALYEIAYRAHAGRSAGAGDRGSAALVTEDLLGGVLQVHLKDSEKVQTFMDYCQSANGLLMLQGTVHLPDDPPDCPPRRVYAFPHLTFEEYLAGLWLKRLRPLGRQVREHLERSDRWREVLLLLGEQLCFKDKDDERLSAILDALCPPAAANAAPLNVDRAAWLAGDLLLLYRRVFPEPAPAESRVILGLQRSLTTAVLPPRERAAAADTLDELGWLPEDLYHFVPVPLAQAPQFYLARYPVTNEQYRRFVEADDFGERALWCGFPRYDERGRRMKEDWGTAGWDWLQAQERDEQGRVYPRLWNDPRFGIARRGAPVVYVTWYEANAYCRWLQQHWGELDEGRTNPGWQPGLVRLPLEAEWIAAAGGAEPGERYPWDGPGQVTQVEAEILRRANVRESGIGRTTPVGMYPLGASPLGVWDMAGNVWEWQANFSGKEHNGLALRGGAWLDPHVSARLSGRYVFHPYFGWYNIGFRVAALPR